MNFQFLKQKLKVEHSRQYGTDIKQIYRPTGHSREEPPNQLRWSSDFEEKDSDYKGEK